MIRGRAAGRGGRPHSIVRNLSVALSLSTMLVSVLVILLFSAFESRKLESDMRGKVGQSIDYLQKILEVPLWNLDDPTVRIIGEAFFHDEDVSRIRISGLHDAVLYSMERPGAQADISVERAVSYEGEAVGGISVAFSRRRLVESIAGMVWNMAATSLLVVLTIFLVTNSLIRLLIKRPLDSFSAMVVAFASKNYSFAEEATDIQEFRPFEQVLRSMGREILEQLDALRGLNKNLEENSIEEDRLFRRVNASELKYRSLFETAQDAIFVMDRSTGALLEENQAARRLYGYSLQEFKAMTFPDMGAEPADSPEAPRGPGEAVPVRIHRRKDGSAFPVEIVSSAFRQGDSEILVSFVRDVSERKKAEGELRVALEEKEALLRELYHRTKNNMQVICALISLQSEYLEDESIKDIFLEIENRIHSMALVHEKLYESHNLTKIGMQEYIRDLAGLILESYRMVGARVSFEYDIDDVQLSIDLAVPCGLILNELISNAFKHAFPGRKEGLVRISLKAEEAGAIALRVSDDGVGVAEGFDFRKRGGMGFKTVLSLGEGQLRGAVEFQRSGGLACTLRFAAKGADGT